MSSATNPKDDESLKWLQRKQFDEICLQFRNTWDLYLKFYTVFLTFNITALGLTIQFMSGVNRVPVIVVFLLQNVLSMITAIRISQFSRKMAIRLERICRNLMPEALQSARVEFRHLMDSPIPGELGYWGGIANAIAHVLMIVCWISLFFLKSDGIR